MGQGIDKFNRWRRESVFREPENSRGGAFRRGITGFIQGVMPSRQQVITRGVNPGAYIAGGIAEAARDMYAGSPVQSFLRDVFGRNGAAMPDSAAPNLSAGGSPRVGGGWDNPLQWVGGGGRAGYGVHRDAGGGSSTPDYTGPGSTTYSPPDFTGAPSTGVNAPRLDGNGPVRGAGTPVGGGGGGQSIGTTVNYSGGRGGGGSVFLPRYGGAAGNKLNVARLMEAGFSRADAEAMVNGSGNTDIGDTSTAGLWDGSNVNIDRRQQEAN